MGLLKTDENKNRIKYGLLVFNLVVMISGIILISIGDGVFTNFIEYDLFLVSYFFWIPILLIIIGSIVIVISFFGCWGTLKENYNLIMIFSMILFLIFILELLAGIAGYVLTLDAELLIKDSFSDSMQKYNSTRPNQETEYWDYLQKTFACCGSESYQDWSVLFKNDLPLSCCALPNGVVGNFSCTNAYEDPNRYSLGCLADFTNYITVNAHSLAEAGIIIAILQFFGVIFVCYVAREIKNRKEMIKCMA